MGAVFFCRGHAKPPDCANIGAHGRNGKEPVISSNKIFVGNLNFKTTEAELRDAMSNVGQVVDVHIPKDRDTGQPRGFAFVEFAAADQVAAAISEFDGKELGGRPLRVNEAQERRPRPSSPPPRFNSGPRQFNDGPDFFDRDAFGGRGSKPKGSRRGMRGKKRSL